MDVRYCNYNIDDDKKFDKGDYQRIKDLCEPLIVALKKVLKKIKVINLLFVFGVVATVVVVVVCCR